MPATLRATMLTAIAILATCTPAPAASPAGEPRIVGPSNRLLALDSRVFVEADNARLVLGKPEKHPGNPLMRSDEPWENSTNNYYPNVAWDADERRWKLWYKDLLHDKDAIAKMDGPSTIHDQGWYLLYATSADGLAWTKPKVGLHTFDGSTANNIVARDCPNAGVFVDAHAPDPGRRYKMVFDQGFGKIFARFSVDGVHWGEPVAMQGFGERNGDTHNNAFYDERSGKYLWFTKFFPGERLVARLESDDFLHWRNSGVVLRSSVDEAKRLQTYALTVFPYGSVYLGYVMMYHVGTDKTVDVELAWSPDSVTWRRVQPGTPFLPLGPAGSIDCGTIYAPAGPAVVRDGRLQIYYGGSPIVHVGWKRNAHLCLATLREDGFTLVDTALPPAAEPPPPRGPVKRGPVVVSFDRDAEGFVGTDKAEAREGHLHVSRAAPNMPFARGTPLAGNWPEILGGDEVTIAARVRSPEPAGTVRIEMGTTGDIPGWYRDVPADAAPESRTAAATIRYDWTDEQARAAGWQRHQQGFSWRDTIRHVGQLVIGAGRGTAGPQTGSFDIDEIRIEAK